jgi:osmotically inducible lipoprotein OsmB
MAKKYAKITRYRYLKGGATMKKTTMMICTAMIAISLLGGCRRSDVGMVGGGVVGGLAGNAITGGSTIGTVVGAVGGGVVGHELAR